MSFTRRTPEEVLSQLKNDGVEIVDIRFCDLPGLMQHYSIPAHELTVGAFEDGSAFDGSSIRGFQEIQESDMLLVPDPDTAVLDPFRQHKTLNLNSFVRDPVTGESYSRDPRYVAHKAEDYLVLYREWPTRRIRPRGRVLHLQLHPVRPERPRGVLLHRFRRRHLELGREHGAGPNLGHRPRHKEGYFPVPPIDRLQEVRSKIMLALIEAGVPVEVQHHEVGTAGQAEIDFRFGPLVTTADRLDDCTSTSSRAWPRRRSHGYVHAEAALWRQRLGHARAPVAVEAAARPCSLRQGRLRRAVRPCARYYIGGLIEARPGHPGVLQPRRRTATATRPGLRGADQPDLLAAEPFGACRIPMYSKSPKSKRIELLADAHPGELHRPSERGHGRPWGCTATTPSPVRSRSAPR